MDEYAPFKILYVISENQFFKACHHGPMTGVRDKPWLKAGSLAHKKLVLALRGYKDSRLKDLRQMTENQHTCKNEQLNNVHNIYMPKHTFFGPVQVEFTQKFGWPVV